MSPRGTELNRKMREKTMERIIDASLEMFSKYGYHGTTMNQIIQHSGLSKGVLYHYFPSKEELFIHLIEEGGKLSREAWQQALEDERSAWDRLVKLTERLYEISFTDKNSLHFLVILQAMTQQINISGLQERMGNLFSHFDWLPPLIEEAQKEGIAAEGDPQVLASTYFALFQGFTIEMRNNTDLLRKISPETFLRVLRR